MSFISLLKTTPLNKIFPFFYFAEVGGGTEAHDGFERIGGERRHQIGSVGGES